MVIFVLAIAASMNIFGGLVNQFKQQSKVAQSNIEGVIGLELMRYDIEQAGFGLPWNLNGATYEEAANTPASNYNDSAVPNPPRGIVTEDNVTMGNTSGYLVVKASNAATSDVSNKWTSIKDINGVRSIDATGSAAEDLQNGEKVIALIPSGMGGQRVLVVAGNQFSTDFNSDPNTWPAAFLPGANTANLIYGISGTTTPRMPFNRADYYVKIPSTNMPQRCAPGTGILYKGTVKHGGTNPGNLAEYPLLDCVAVMKTVCRLDQDGNGVADFSSTTLQGLGLAADQIRTQLKEVRVYILAQEGQIDFNYTYLNPTNADPANPVYAINDPDTGNVANVDLNTLVGANWRNYRWKLYTLVVTPYNLMPK